MTTQFDRTGTETQRSRLANMSAKHFFVRVAVLLWFSHIAATTFAATTIPVDGEPFDAKLQVADDSWNLQFVTDAGEAKTIEAANLVQWGAWNDPKGTKLVVLADGGVLVAADLIGIQDDKLMIESDTLSLPTIKLPISAVAGVIYQSPLDLRKSDLLQDRLLAADGGTDRVLLANGDELRGVVATLSDKSLQLTSAAGVTPIDLSRVAAVVFNPTLRSKQPPDGLSAWIGLSDGSRLRATKLHAKDGKAHLTLSGDTIVRVPLDAIVAIQPIGGSVVYLSQLTPTSYKHIPFLDLPWEYRNNRSATGGALRAGKQRYLMGLGMHSAARLTYDLDAGNNRFEGAVRRFEASLAIDDETAGRGSVIARVFTDDGSGEWKSRYESPAIRGGQPPVPVSVDLTGAKRISLLIDFGDRADEGDHVDWLNARLVK